MSGPQTADATTRGAGVATVIMRLEVVVIPVSDVDRAMGFYSRLGWRLDNDLRRDDGYRGVQYTPPGSGCSVQFGTRVTSAEPGSAQGLHLIVSDIVQARADLVARGIDVSEIFHCGSGYACRFPGNDAPIPGAHPDRATYGSFLTFDDPDGNSWLLQEITTRFPGRVEGGATYASVGDLSEALERAATAHGDHAARTGQADAEWPKWYAEYLVREQSGEAPA